MRVDLARDVVVVRAARLDDQPDATMDQLEDGRRDQAPAVVLLDDGTGQPLVEQHLLIGRQLRDAGSHRPIVLPAMKSPGHDTAEPLHRQSRRRIPRSVTCSPGEVAMISRCTGAWCSPAYTANRKGCEAWPSA